MLKLKIPHDYTERPGKHEWPYWRNSISYHLLFFSKFFGKYPIEEK
jgi:S-formylglutathione hydrolase FrmB